MSTAAVFLSYASQDADAARRICEALRAAGVEVWFDQSELVGGDAWDTKIRRQIKECALFVPLISASTQARVEGYFRLEWKLAADRSHLIARDHPFILPIVIDDTANAAARVPDEFHAVQWTRLSPGGEPTAFGQRVKTLLAASAASAGEADSGHGELQAPAKPGRDVASKGKPASRWVTVALGAILFAALALWQPWRRGAPGESAVATNDKSIAVLPFTNASEDKEANAFFSEGIHEDILTNLALIRELTVVSRTSVMEYRATTKKVRQIGEELGVAYLLEGSVRRAGNAVRVTGKLIDARTDKHVWAGNFDRDLTASAIFAIQTELAKEIASALHARLSPQEKGLLERPPTTNLAAYELFLQARQKTSASERETLLQQAVMLDPGFAVAWARLGWVHSVLHFDRSDHTPARLEKAKAAIDTAVRLAPDHPEVINALGRYYYSAFRDYGRALEQFERVLRLQPNYAEGWHSIAAVHRRQGRWAEAAVGLRRALALDPASSFHWTTLIQTLEGGRRYEEARREQRAYALRTPENIYRGFRVGWFSFLASGSTQEMEMFIARLTTEQAASEAGVEVRKVLAEVRGDAAQFLLLDRPDADLDFIDHFDAAVMLAAYGDRSAALKRLPDAAPLRLRLAREPQNPEVWSRLGLLAALSGDEEEAVKCARRAVDLLPESLDAYSGPLYGGRLAFVYAWTGDKERAIAEYARLLSKPDFRLNVHIMKRSPHFHPLRGDPHFEALLNDPRNNAPLF